MKNLMSKKWLGIPLLVIIVVCLTTTAVGAVAGLWVTGHLTTTGTITINAPPPPDSYTYSLSTTAISFPNTTFNNGDPINLVSNNITITNTGNKTINSLSLTQTGGSLPSGWAISNIQYQTLPLAPSASESFHVTLTGTANNSTSGTITVDLSPITFDLNVN